MTQADKFLYLMRESSSEMKDNVKNMDASCIVIDFKYLYKIFKLIDQLEGVENKKTIFLYNYLIQTDEKE